MDIRRVDFDHPEYPPLLRQIHGPPKALYVRGPLDLGPCVAVVGTRRMTDYGRRVVGLLVPELVRLGLTVVSGLALGVDGAAHQESIDAGGRTAAVLGSGIDDDAIYPRAHLGLARRILEAGGTIISEHPPGTESLPYHFPRRNRIVAGLSQAVLLIEAPEKSGAMITARLALESGRDVWVVPGEILHESSRGPNRLLKEGATPITGLADLSSALGAEPPSPIPRGLDPDETAVAEALKDGPLVADKIAKATDRSPAKVSVILTRLELKGAVASLGGSRYGLLH